MDVNVIPFGDNKRKRETLRFGLARQYPRGIIIRVEFACVPIPLGLTHSPSRRRTVNSVLIREASPLLAQHIASDHRQLEARCFREREGGLNNL